MFKLPLFMEHNSAPSNLNTSSPSGAASQLANVAEKTNSFDGVTIESMRDNPLYQKVDDIDKIGLAQKKIVDAASKVKSKSKYIRALNERASKRTIPSSKNY